MLDRAEALFRSRRDFSNICEQAVGIGTKHTADLLDRIQIGQTPSIEDEVVSAPNLRDSIDGKTHGLIERDPKIQDEKGNGTSVDQRDGQYHQHFRSPNVLPNRRLEQSMLGQGFWRKGRWLLPPFRTEALIHYLFHGNTSARAWPWFPAGPAEQNGESEPLV